MNLTGNGFLPLFFEPGLLSMGLQMADQVTQARRQQFQQQEQQARARWTSSLTKILADLMIDLVQKGNRHGHSFGNKAWRYICDEFYKKTGLNWDKEQLKNRYAVLRRQYVTVKSLLDQRDFSWDESMGTIIAKDEAWTEYIRGHPDAETLKYTGCPIYKELCIIFSEPTTNGKHNLLAEHEGGMIPVTCAEPLSMHLGESSSDSDEVDDIADACNATRPTTPCTTGNRKRGRKGIDDVIAGAIMEMAAASKLRTAAIQQCNARYTITDCIKELDEMQGVDERVYFAALELFNKPNAREVFLSLKSDKRLIWLRGKCAAYPAP